MSITNTTVLAILATINEIVANSSAFETPKEEVEKLSAALDALIESGAVYSWEEGIRETKDAAGLFLGTHEVVFVRYECGACSTSSHRQEDRFCFMCGKECERQEQISKKYEPFTQVSKCEIVRMACARCGEKIYMEKGAKIRFHSTDGGKYERLQAEVEGEAFAAEVGPVWKQTLELLAKVGGNNRAVMSIAFEETAKFIFAKLFVQMGPRLPFMIEGLKIRFGSVLIGLGHYVQGTEMLTQGLVRAQDAKGMIPKIHGLNTKLQALAAMTPQIVEAMLSSQDPEHLARCFAQGAMLGLQMNCSVKTIRGMQKDPMVACLEEAAEAGFDWAELYVVLDSLATWAEAKHL